MRERVAYLLLAIVYVVSGKLGLLLALPPGYASPIFPAAGIAVTAAFISGKKSLPWIFLGSLLLNIWLGYSSGNQFTATALSVALVIAIASMLQAALGGWGLRRAIGYPAPLDHSVEVMRFLLLSPLICLTSATLSVTGLWALSVIDTSGIGSNWVSWWIGDTLGVVLMLPLVLIVAGEPRELWRKRKFMVAIPMLVIFVIFATIYLKASQWEYDDSLMEFRQLSQQTVNQIQGKFEEQEFLLEQTAGLFVHDEHNRVTRDQFHRFVSKALSRFSMIQALERAPYIDKADRANFETAQRKDLPGFEIKERNATGQLQRASDRGYFYPVTFVEPLVSNESALGFDLASNAARQAALNGAKQSGKVVASAAVKLVQERQHQVGVLLILAVNPRDNKSDVVLTVLRVDDFMDKLLPDSRPMLYTRLIDRDEGKAIYDNFEMESTSAIYRHDFDFGLRHYRLETLPTSAYFMQHRSWHSWSLLAAGILGTGLLGSLLLLGTGYTARIEALVLDRTRKLEESDEGHKQAEQALQIESEKNYAILRNASDGIHILDVDGNVIEASDSFCTMLGYRRDEVIGMNVARWDAQLTDDERLLALKKMFAKHSRFEFETRHRRKDGTVLNVEVSAMSLELNGKPALFNSSRDITERKRANDAVRESETQLRTMLENELVGIVMVKNRTIQWTNPAFEKMLGYEPGELTGSPTRQNYLSDEEYQNLGDKAYPVISAGQIFRTEVWHRRKDGRLICVDMSGSNLNPVAGETLWGFIDITARVEMEQELKRSNTELEQFSYAISHDMRQPLRMISSYLQLMQMSLAEKLDNTNREYVNFAIDGAKRLDQMLLGLLDYSRVGRKNDPFAWVDSRIILDEAILFLRPAIAEAQAILEIEGEWPRVWVSRDEIMRLLQNLLGNALKYRGANHIPQIRVVSEAVGDMWRVSVVDNGIGIDPAQIGRLFQVFQRLQSHAKYEGNGVGLALCRRIVEHHSGRIWAESSGENQGSTFSFELKQEQ